jgi:hypothetical protein
MASHIPKPKLPTAKTLNTRPLNEGASLAAAPVAEDDLVVWQPPRPELFRRVDPPATVVNTYPKKAGKSSRMRAKRVKGAPLTKAVPVQQSGMTFLPNIAYPVWLIFY